MRKRDVEYLGAVGNGWFMWRHKKDRTQFYVIDRSNDAAFTGYYRSRNFQIRGRTKRHVSTLATSWAFGMNSRVIRFGCMRFNRALVEDVIRAHNLPLIVERRSGRDNVES